MIPFFLEAFMPVTEESVRHYIASRMKRRADAMSAETLVKDAANAFNMCQLICDHFRSDVVISREEAEQITIGELARRLAEGQGK